jgi:hypothetical protein
MKFLHVSSRASTIQRRFMQLIISVAFAFCLAILFVQACSRAVVVKPMIVEIYDLKGHSDAVESVVFSPDGTLALSGSNDNTIKLWDVLTGEELRTYRGHQKCVTSLAFSPDGRFFVSGSRDNTAKLWNVQSGEEIRTFRRHSEWVTAVAYSPDGRFFATGSWDYNIKLWEVSTFLELRTFRGHSNAVYAIDFSPDGNTIVSGGRDSKIHLWDVGTGNIISELKGHSGHVEAVAFNPDGRRVLSGGSDNSIKLWDVEKGIELNSYHIHNGKVNSVLFSPDGLFAASASDDGRINLFDLSSGKNINVFSRHTNKVNSISFSPNGQFLLSASDDHAIKLWDLFIGVPLNALSVYQKFIDQKVYLEKLNSNFNSIVDQRLEGLTSDLMIIQQEFETFQAYRLRLEEAEKKRAEFRSEVEQQLHRELRELSDEKANTLTELNEILQQKTEVDVELGDYDPNKQTLEIRVIDNQELVPMTIELERSELVVPLLRAGNITSLATFRYVEEEKVFVRDLIIDDPTGGPTITYNYQYQPEWAMLTPSNLVLEDFSFHDDGDNILLALERAILQFRISNTGEGTAKGVHVKGVTTSSIDGLEAFIGDIEPGETRVISLTMSARRDIEDGEAIVLIKADEQRGFHATPFRVPIQTRSYRPSDFVLNNVRVEVDNEQNVIVPGQIAKVTALITNRGSGFAEDVRIKVSLGDNVSFASDANRSREYYQGAVGPGESMEVQFEVFARNRDDFPVTVSVVEGTGQLGMLPTNLGLRLDNIPEPEWRPHQQLVSIEKDIPQAPQPNPDAVAVIIGNQNYRYFSGIDDVTFAPRDAELTRRYVEQTFGYKSDNIIYMLDASLSDMRNIWGTELNHRGKLYGYVKKDISDVFVFYSGHAGPCTNTNKVYLMPVEGDPNRLGLSGYSLDLLYENLSKLGARSVTFVIDACYSGFIGSGGMLVSDASPPGLQVKVPNIQIPNSIVFTASRENEIATWYSEKRYGLFTYYFLKGLQGEADLNNDGVISVEEMKRFLQDPVNGVPYMAERLMNRSQNPQIWGDPNAVIVSFCEEE